MNSVTGEDGSIPSDEIGRAESKEASLHPADDLLIPPESAKSPDLSVVIPTFNEEEGIEECLLQIKNAIERLDLTAEIILSDSSTDNTPEIGREMEAIIHTPDDLGYGYAYRSAFKQARGDYIVIGDGDTTYDFEEMPKLFNLVSENGTDIALGSRLNGTIRPGAMPSLHQYIGNPLLTKFLNVFYGAGVSDAHSGFRVIKREALDELDLRTDGMEFASEMIMDAGAKGLEIDEVPITYHERKGEATLSSFRDGWRHVKFMLTNAPTYLFSVPALLLCTLGVLTILISFFGSTVAGITFGTHTVIAGSLFTIVGYQIGTLALFSSVALNPVREQRDPITNQLRQYLTLERGAILGALLTVVGGGYAAYLVGQWVASGYVQRPFVGSEMLVFTLVVIGGQTIFSSFFFGMLFQERRSDEIITQERA